MNGFIEIRSPPPPFPEETTGSPPPLVEAWVVTVQPSECSALVQWCANEYPPAATEEWSSHLKRVQRQFIRKTDGEEGAEPAFVDTASPDSLVAKAPRKRRRADTKNISPDFTLKVLLKRVNDTADSDEEEYTELRNKIATQLQRDSVELERYFVPQRPPQSMDEYHAFNTIWPTVYLPHQMQEYQEQQRQLDVSELELMRRGLSEAVADARFSMGGVVVLCPTTGRVVATASREFLQISGRAERKGDNIRKRNPLVTPYLLAIQGVSRIERSSISSSQYLCTGYDVYGVAEPTVFEAMALVHSRIRRLVFGCRRQESKGSGIVDARVHALPGTNHHFRAFTPEPDVWEQVSKEEKACQRETQTHHSLPK